MQVGPCTETFGMNIREGAPAGEARPLSPQSVTLEVFVAEPMTFT